MLKPYHRRLVDAVAVVEEQAENGNPADETSNVDEPTIKAEVISCKLPNPQILQNLDTKLSHLEPDKQMQMKNLILRYENLFPDVP